MLKSIMPLIQSPIWENRRADLGRLHVRPGVVEAVDRNRGW
jgi:hypothetical protein